MPMSDETVTLAASGLVKNFPFDSRRIDVLRGVDLRAQSGELIGIVGASGTGKSTLLQILGGLDKPSEGSVKIDGVDILSLSDDNRTRLRGGKVGFVFQYHHLLPEFSAMENVIIPAKIAGNDEKKTRKKALELFESVGLAHRTEHRPGKLSGGEQQRTAVVRALINDPILLLADEPTGNLDERTADDIFELIKKLIKERGLASIVVTHNLRLADRMDIVYELHEGRLRNTGRKG
ncbi:MAG: lipoprotein-releasing system ATP-binding protein LolD [bacterium]|nr:MAG: lipoprotein-releasing system ATP-binding protein LolD [bacterium]